MKNQKRKIVNKIEEFICGIIGMFMLFGFPIIATILIG